MTELDLQLAPGTILTVEVLDSSGPVSDAQVEVWSSDGLQVPNAMFTAMGKETIGFGPVPPGAYTVTARRGGESARTTVAVAGGSDQTVQLMLGG